MHVQAGLARLRQVEHGLDRAVPFGLVGLQHRGAGLELLQFARQPGLLARTALVTAHGVGDVGQVAHPCAGHDRHLVGAVSGGHRRQRAFAQLQAQCGQPRLERLVQRSDAVIVEAAGHGAEDRHGFGRLLEGFAVALHLLGDIAQRIGGALAVELVDRHELGEVEHVDLLQLAGRAELRGHHVHRYVHQRHDGRVALADAGGLDDDQVEAGHLARVEHVRQGLADFAAVVARGQAAHEHARAVVVGAGSCARVQWHSCGCGRPAMRRRSCAGWGRC